MHSQRLAVLGECMVEVKPRSAPGADSVFAAGVGFGGDTLNCALYLARLGWPVEYVTALGDDLMSDWLVSQWRAEGVGCSHVQIVAGAVPGLYLINTDEHGERSFLYWREQAPVRRMLDSDAQAEKVFSVLGCFEHIYLSGITLALFPEPGRRRLFGFLSDYRAAGGRVVFDNNYRVRQWSDVADAQSVFVEMYRCCDVALATAEDHHMLFGHCDDADMLGMLGDLGVDEIVIKLGAGGCIAAHGGEARRVSALAVDRVVDTTAAGDSFNAGYLSARFDGEDVATAAERGNRLASLVVQHPGAIMPRDAMAELCSRRV